MIQDGTPDFHAKQDELARQYRRQQRKDDMNAAENIAAGAEQVSAGGLTQTAIER